MPRFPAMDLVRGFALKTSAGRKGGGNSGRDGAERYGQIRLTAGSAELAEQLVSAVILGECLLRCGSLSRGCGLPAGNLCLLAIQGRASQPDLAVALSRLCPPTPDRSLSEREAHSPAPAGWREHHVPVVSG
jgi:hypothetical protein